MDTYQLKLMLYRILHAGKRLSMNPEDRLTRHLCCKDIREWLAVQQKRIEGRVLCISGTPPFVDRAVPGIEITETSYPEIDIHKLPYPDQSFDWVISEQVIEHVEDPKKAVAESFRVLKKGGLAIHTTVSLYMQHDSPGDYWRFLPDGLRLLCRDFSRIHRCHHWGSPRAVQFLISHPELWLDPAAYIGYSPSVKAMALDHDANWPILIWIIAEK